MKEGDVVIAPLAQADGTVKNLPAVLLRELPGYGDFLACGVSTQRHQCIAGFDELISPADADYAASGVNGESIIRLGFLGLLPRKKIAGSIGAVSDERHRRMLSTLADYLRK